MVGRSTAHGHAVPWIAAWGHGRQRLHIVPSHLAVAITAGLWDTSTRDQVVLGVLEDHVLAAVQPWRSPQPGRGLCPPQHDRN